jgi:hypothetical protein
MVALLRFNLEFFIFVNDYKGFCKKKPETSEEGRGHNSPSPGSGKSQWLSNGAGGCHFGRTVTTLDVRRLTSSIATRFAALPTRRVIGSRFATLYVEHLFSRQVGNGHPVQLQFCIFHNCRKLSEFELPTLLKAFRLPLVPGYMGMDAESDPGSDVPESRKSPSRAHVVWT